MLEDKERKFAWDGQRSRSVLIARRMAFDDPVEVFRDYGEEVLKEVFFRHYYLLDRRSRNFWKIILEISDEEVEKRAKKSIRESSKIWDY